MSYSKRSPERSPIYQNIPQRHSAAASGQPSVPQGYSAAATGQPSVPQGYSAAASGQPSAQQQGYYAAPGAYPPPYGGYPPPMSDSYPPQTGFGGYSYQPYNVSVQQPESRDSLAKLVWPLAFCAMIFGSIPLGCIAIFLAWRSSEQTTEQGRRSMRRASIGVSIATIVLSIIAIVIIFGVLMPRDERYGGHGWYGHRRYTHN